MKAIKLIVCLAAASLLFSACMKGSPAKEIIKSGNQKAAAKDYDGALAEYDKAIKADPNFSEGYFNRAFLNIMIYNKTKDACSDLKKAKDLGHNYADNLLKQYCEK